METKKEKYFDWRLCRTCMAEAGETTVTNEERQQLKWQSIFESVEVCGGTLSIAELLSSTMPQIEVTLEDSLPKKICHACLQHLTSVHRFQQMCLRSDREMRNMVAKMYSNSNEVGSDILAEDQILHFEVLEARNEEEAVDILTKEEQQIIISEQLQNFGETIETCRNTEEDICDNSDEYVTADNHQEALCSTIYVKEVVTEATKDSSKNVCALCKKKFKEYRYLQRHMKLIHAVSTEKRKKEMSLPAQLLKVCDVCEKTFSSRHTLRRHKIKEHSIETTKKRKQDDHETIGSLNDHEHMIAEMYANSLEIESDVLAEEQILHPAVLEERSEDEAVDILTKEEQQTIISEQLQNVGEKVETCGDTEVDKCDNNDAYFTADDNQEAFRSTINVKDVVVIVATKDSSKHICALCEKKFKECRYLKRHMKLIHAVSREKKTKEMALPEQQLKVCDVGSLNDHENMIDKMYVNSNEEVSDILAEEQILNFEVLEERSEDVTVDILPKEHQQTIISEQPQNGETIELCRDKQEDICDNNDEYVAANDHQAALRSTINVNDEVVTVATKDLSKHVCALCKKKFKESRYLKKHMKLHASSREKKKKEKPLPVQQLKVCDVCKKTCSSRHSLRRHKIKEHSTQTMKKRKGDDHETIGSLNDHEPTQTAERPYLCPECGKSYKTSDYLTQHRLRHSDARPFECPICPARFRCRADISKHKVIHDIKRHVCDICGEGFAKSYALTAHKRYHSGEKPFKCDYCQMCFVDRAHLRRHVRKHTGEKPYSCKYCERTFTQPNEQIKHLRTHLGENIYVCSLCPSTFRLASERRAHFVTHKNDDKETRERNMRDLKAKEAELQSTFFKVDA